MPFLHKIINRIDQFTLLVGRSIAWLTLLMMLVTCTVVALRYGPQIGSIALQESITYLHATVFLLGCSFTLQRGGHVRVDIFYRRFTAKRRALIDFLGGLLFLIPLCLFILWSCWDYVAQAWAIKESSPEAGGLPAVFVLKTLMPVMAICLLIQGIGETLRNFLRLIINDPVSNDDDPANTHVGL